MCQVIMYAVFLVQGEEKIDEYPQSKKEKRNSEW